MPYTRKKVDGTFERRFCIGLIVSNKFIKESISLYRPELIENKIVSIIAKWCYNYYEKYNTPPDRHIQELFEQEDIKQSEEFSSFIKNLLSSLSDEWEREDKFNVDFLLDEAEKYFKSKHLLHLAETIKEKTNVGDILGAEAVFSQSQIVNRLKGNWINPLINEELIKGAFDEMQEPLFKLPSALGKMMNAQLTRGSFISFLGREKIGKSYWLIEMTVRALRNRCNVAFFELGDMTEKQWTARLHSYLSQKPLPRFAKKDSIIKVPAVRCLLRETCKKEKCVDTSDCKRFKHDLYYEERKVDPLSWKDALEEGKKFFQRLRGKQFRFSSHSSGSFRVRDIDNMLEVWKNTEDFVPDVIIIDYIDIAAPEDARKDSRGQENDKWMALRRLSQKWKVLVITATQANAASYEKDTLTLSNFSEDKRKHAHVTAEYGLNQRDWEKDLGLLRISEIVVREGGLHNGKQVTVGECRQIGRPHLFSFFSSKNILKNNSKNDENSL